ncbi:sensor histidine kinase [Nocardioides cavernae]|uniref:Oxygen sensor histidine kinase NreB n=1 Tax=Nocardioides cavernae TaxID=1921566 RepID=A0ABR8N8B4_9ACTN|nr:sensor histidine kinase [Nocardioides cavernae]MBD3924378.1 sensor histidine kinase [Nocardioides cavernae]MBM7510676.1 signal transduction histidine kinase [Nocardioides cavernae]
MRDQRDQHPWRLGPRGRRWLDRLIVAFVLVVGGLGHAVAGQPVATVFTVAEVLPLLWRRRHPWPVFLVVAAASALQAAAFDQPAVGQLAFPVAVYSVARWSPRWQGVTALLVGYAGALVAATRWLFGFGAGDLTPGNLAPYTVTIGAIVTAAWALGWAAQSRERYVASLVARAEQAERMAEREVELAARDERSRIAREMHDVVAHGLSVIVVQADGARYAAAKDPDVAVGTLETISATGREALTEMRRLLGLLREGDTGVTPQPGLGDVRHLVDEARAAGMRVAADLPEPAPDVPDGVGLAAYRIVQEALTNVRKHAGPDATVDVRVAVDRGVAVDVRDDGRGAAARADGRGLGLVGMRERASVHGGTLEAGPAPGGGFAVSARLPL